MHTWNSKSVSLYLLYMWSSFIFTPHWDIKNKNVAQYDKLTACIFSPIGSSGPSWTKCSVSLSVLGSESYIVMRFTATWELCSQFPPDRWALHGGFTGTSIRSVAVAIFRLYWFLLEKDLYMKNNIEKYLILKSKTLWFFLTKY